MLIPSPSYQWVRFEVCRPGDGHAPQSLSEDDASVNFEAYQRHQGFDDSAKTDHHASGSWWFYIGLLYWELRCSLRLLSNFANINSMYNVDLAKCLAMLCKIAKSWVCIHLFSTWNYLYIQLCDRFMGIVSSDGTPCQLTLTGPIKPMYTDRRSIKVLPSKTLTLQS